MNYKVVFFVPIDHAEKVKNAVFSSGAGKMGHYDCCSFEVEGVGQFRPLKGSNPFIGKELMTEKVRELRVETVCQDKYLKEVLRSLRAAHPYEVPAIDVIKLEEDSFS